MTNLPFEREKEKEKENGLFIFIFLIFGIGDQRVCVYVFDAHYKHSSGAPKNTMAD